MSKIDLYKGDCLEVMDKAKEIFNENDLSILFTRDLGKFESKHKKYDANRFKPFQEKRIEDTVVEKGLK